MWRESRRSNPGHSHIGPLLIIGIMLARLTQGSPLTSPSYGSLCSIAHAHHCLNYMSSPSLARALSQDLSLPGLGGSVPERRDFPGTLTGCLKFQEHHCLERRVWLGKPWLPPGSTLGKRTCREVFYFTPSQLSSSPRLSGPHPFTARVL